VEPAPEIVPEPVGGVVAVFALALELVLAVVELVVELLVELELPHAARPNASTAQPASALILFLITTSPLAGFSVDCARGAQFCAESACRGKSFQPPVASM
jgi:hypothetical protein